MGVTIPEVKAKMANVERTVASTEKRNEKLKGKVNELTESLQTTTQRLERGDQETARIIESDEDLDAKVNSHKNAADYLRHRAKALKAKKPAAESERFVTIPEVKAKVANVEKTVASTEKTNEKLKGQVNELTESLQTATQRLERGGKETAKIIESLEDFDAKVESRKKAADSLMLHVKALKAKKPAAEVESTDGLADELESSDPDEMTDGTTVETTTDAPVSPSADSDESSATASYEELVPEDEQNEHFSDVRF